MKTVVRALRIAPAIGLFLLGVLVSTAGHAQTAAPYTAGYYYNIGGQLTGVVQPCVDGGCPATEYIYNSAGLVFTVYEGALGSWPGTTPPTSWSWLSINRVTVKLYDSLGRLSTEAVESQSDTPYKLTQYAYDNMSRMECVAVRMNPAVGSGTNACTLTPESSYGYDRITYTTYDAQNNKPLVITRGYGTANQQNYATYTYNSDGLVSTIMDANNNLTTLGYDGFDRVAVQEFPSKSVPKTSDSSDEEQYAYDKDNNRTTRITRDGQTIYYDYDALNRMDEKIAPNEQAVYYGYDLQNQRMYANFASQTGQGVSDIYDGFGDLTSETVDLSGTAQTMAYQYNADGDRTRVTYPDLNYVTYTYDGLDRLSQVLESGSTVLAAYSYNAAGELTGITRGGGSPATVLGYDAIARLSSLSQTLATSADNVSFSYQYNPADQIVSDNISNTAYYPLVNGTTQSYAPNGLNEYATVGGTTYSYDGRGNLTSDGATSYSYDVENRLLQAQTSGGNANLSYDPLGRLYSVTNTAGTTTTFLYDGDRITAEYDASGNLLQRYVYGEGGDDPLVWYDGSSFGAATRQYLLANRQGSIIDVTDSNGNALAVNQYHPYGLGGSTNEGRFQFTGQAYIPEIGLYYYKARMYNPSIGRFMQTDPIGYKSDLDLYAYGGNDPIDKVDPHGTSGVFGLGYTASQLMQMGEMAQVREELAIAEYKISQAALLAGAATSATVALVTRGTIGNVAQGISIALSAAAIQEKRDFTGTYDWKDAAVVAAGSVPGVGEVGEGVGDALKLKNAEALGETLKATQEFGHATAAGISAAAAIGSAHAAIQGSPQGGAISGRSQDFSQIEQKLKMQSESCVEQHSCY